MVIFPKRNNNTLDLFTRNSDTVSEGDSKRNSQALTLVFAANLEQGSVPADWKLAHVTPVFKK
ncbi:hypothetical protein DPMN_188869 [Dreissena polymorpha]|uniref:Uncharacterized protein n=1 Tax=Dreissena polymorpha TaxID=45954 RepID=A0A9D4DTU2_DREPO|nr:hypothetical protein DPMN_188869 [Dreissena polymorpha]